jgi:hypothetical protein
VILLSILPILSKTILSMTLKSEGANMAEIDSGPLQLIRPFSANGLEGCVDTSRAKSLYIARPLHKIIDIFIGL